MHFEQQNNQRPEQQVLHRDCRRAYAWVGKRPSSLGGRESDFVDCRIEFCLVFLTSIVILCGGIWTPTPEYGDEYFGAESIGWSA